MNSSRISRLAREKEIDDLKEPIALVMENVSRKLTDLAMGNVDQKPIVRVIVSGSRRVTAHVMVNASQKVTAHGTENVDQKEPINHAVGNDVLKGIVLEKVTVVLKGQIAHVTENADRKATAHEKEIVLDRWKVVDRHSSACWIRTRMGDCRKTNSPRPPNCLMNWIAITMASLTPPSCLVARADQKVDLHAKETHRAAANEAMSLVTTLHVVMLHDATEPPEVMVREATPHAVMHHGVMRHLKEIAQPVNDGLTPTVRGEIASLEQKQIANEDQRQSSNAWIATVTERSPKTKLRKQ